MASGVFSLYKGRRYAHLDGRRAWRALPRSPNNQIRETPVSPMFLRILTLVAVSGRVWLRLASGRSPPKSHQARSQQGLRRSHPERADRHPGRRQGRLQGEEARAPRRSAPTPATCRSPTSRTRASRTRSPRCSARRWARKVTFYWRPFLERGADAQTFDQGMCDVLFDMPANYGSLLTTVPIYAPPTCSPIATTKASI